MRSEKNDMDNGLITLLNHCLKPNTKYTKIAAIYNFDTITFSPHNIGKPTKSTNSTVKCLELQKATLELSFFGVYNQESSYIQSIVIQCTMEKCNSGGRPIICTNWQLFHYL